MAELKVRLEIGFSRRFFRWALGAVLLAVCAPELGSENVTLSTYYPAPSGVYTQMITTSNAWLARDQGKVGVGTRIPEEKLDVAGNLQVRGHIIAKGNVSAENVSAAGVTLGNGGVSPAKGTLAYRNGLVQVWNGSAWQPVGSGGNSGPEIISGSNPTCPTGKSAMSYYWKANTNSCCTTAAGWAGTAPACTQTSQVCVKGYNTGGKWGTFVCTQYGLQTCSNTATSWTQVQCQ